MSSLLSNGVMESIDQFIDAQAADLQAMRRTLHANPEPSGEEVRTTAWLLHLLEDIEGIQYRTGPDGRGLIVDSGTTDVHRCLAMRADIDALRLQDEKTVVYRSKERNIMHACGHDAHTAMAFYALKALAAHPDALPEGIAWRCIFQPAEESATGAKEMIAAGALEGVDTIIALHVDPTLMVGQVGFREGPLTAHCEEFEINIEGEGGHGARPESTRDPVAAATHLVQSVYASLPRRLDSREPLVVSFGVIQGGINPNVIPQSVQLRGTMRSFDAEHLRNARQRLQGICDSVAQMHQLEVRYEVSWDLPAVINDPHIIATARRSAASILPPGGAVEIPHPSMGGEDFAHYLRHCRGGMFRLGVGTPLQPVHHLHSPRFDLNEKALPIGSKLLARTLLQLAS